MSQRGKWQFVCYTVSVLYRDREREEEEEMKRKWGPPVLIIMWPN